VNGHDYAALTKALTDPPEPGKLTFVIANPTKGKGVLWKTSPNGIAACRTERSKSRRWRNSTQQHNFYRSKQSEQRIAKPTGSLGAVLSVVSVTSGSTMSAPAAKAMAGPLGLKMGRANLEEFVAPPEERVKAAEYADQYLNGKRDFRQRVPVKVDLVTPQNVHKCGFTCEFWTPGPMKRADRPNEIGFVFSSLSRFHEAFKRWCGGSPKEYRNKHRAD
jgi:hypothetical protein